MVRYRNPQNFLHRAGYNDPLSIAGIPMKVNFDEIHESINLEYDKFIIKFFFMNFEVKIAVKMNLRIITKNHAADPEIGFLTKSISKANRCTTAIPTAWELSLEAISSFGLSLMIKNQSKI